MILILQVIADIDLKMRLSIARKDNQVEPSEPVVPVMENSPIIPGEPGLPNPIARNAPNIP